MNPAFASLQSAGAHLRRVLRSRASMAPILLLAVATALFGCAGTERIPVLSEDRPACGDDCPGWTVLPSSQTSEGAELVGTVMDELAAMGFVDATVIVKDGAIVAEAYRNGYGPDIAHQISSVSKSVLSALVGIAIEERLIASIDQPISELLPPGIAERVPATHPPIALRHLMSMSMGFSKPDSADAYLAWRMSGNRAKHTLTRRLKHPPGTVWAYNNGAAHLVSLILTHKTGETTKAFAESRLFEPLGIHVPRWPQDGQGYYVGGTEMHMTARDLARFGQLYLDRGRSADRQAVPEDWIDASTRPSGLEVRKDWGEFGYGLFWWTKTIGDVEAFIGRGWGAQFLYVAPRLGLVIVVLSDPPVLPSTAIAHWNAVGETLDRFLFRLSASSGGVGE